MSFKVLASTENMPYADWLALRKLGIGGSDASVICGINRWKSMIELYMDKTGQLQTDDDAGEFAYWGNQLENLVRAEFTKRTGLEVTLVKQVLQSVEYPFMLANLDGEIEHPEYGKCLFEAKTCSAFRANEWEGDKLPDEYQIQIMHYLAVTGYKFAFIAVLVGGNTFKWKMIECDDELIAIIIEMEKEFWNHVQEGVPPVLDGSEASAKFLNQRFPDSVPLSKIKLPLDAAVLIQQYDAACEQMKQIEEQKTEAENLLKEMLGNNEAGVLGDKVMVTWKTVTQERLDTRTLKVEHPALYKKFANMTQHRRFAVKSAS